MRPLFPAAALAALFLLAQAPAARAFQKESGPPKECGECHTMTPEDAGKILEGAVDNVVGVLPGPIPGIWEIDVERGGKKYPLYLDYSGRYLFNGQVIRMSDRLNLTGERYTDLNRVDVSSIPLDGAIVIGNPKAARKVVVFDDLDCPYCAQLHGEIKKVVAADPETAFYIRIYSRTNSPAGNKKAKSILCAKKNPAKLLDDAFAGKPIPPADCKTTAVDDTMRLAARLQIQGTPTMVLPDGRLISGFLKAEALRDLLRGM